MKRKVLLLCVDGLGADYFEDGRARLQNIRGLAEKGSRVKRLATIFPAVTWAAHTSVVTGCYPDKHGIVGNHVFDRKDRKSKNYYGVDIGLKHELVQVPAIYDILSQKGVCTAAICWPLTQGTDNIRFNIPEFYCQSAFERYASVDFWNGLKEQGLPVDRYADWSCAHSKGPMQDWLTKEIVHAVIRDGGADFIMAHYLLVDSFLHDFGGYAPEVLWAIEYVDSLIGETLAFMDEAGVLADTEILVFSDHGHRDITYSFHTNRVLMDNSLYDPEEIGACKYISVANGGSVYLYNLSDDKSLDDTVAAIFREFDFIRDIHSRDNFPALHLPVSTGHPGGYVPDLILELKSGYCGANGTDAGGVRSGSKYRSTHGYSPSEAAMDGLMVAAGRGISEGITVERAGLIDIAPTIASLFGLDLPGCDGKVLTRILK